MGASYFKWDGSVPDGDLNLNFLTWLNPQTSHAKKLQPLVRALFDKILPYGFVQLVTEATRFMPGVEPSGLDHVYSNHPDHLSEVQVIFKGSSDHRLTLVTRHTKSVVRRTRIIKRRSYKNFNPSDFIEKLKKISWLDVYLCEDVNFAVQTFSKKINEILDALAPMRTIQVRKNYAPWLSQDTKDLMKERDHAQQRASITNLDQDWNYYRHIRNQVNRVLKNEKAQWQIAQLKSLGSDSGLMWKNLKDWFGWKKQGPPTKLIKNGQIFTKPSQLSKIMNEHFTEKIGNHVSNLMPPQSCPIEPVKKMMESKYCSFNLKPVHPDQIEEIINNMKSSSSSGLDSIDIKMIKLGKTQLLPVITHIVNLSIATKTFPGN